MTGEFGKKFLKKMVCVNQKVIVFWVTTVLDKNVYGSISLLYLDSTFVSEYSSRKYVPDNNAYNASVQVPVKPTLLTKNWILIWLLFTPVYQILCYDSVVKKSQPS